jgi:hypothetical protein
MRDPPAPRGRDAERDEAAKADGSEGHGDFLRDNEGEYEHRDAHDTERQPAELTHRLIGTFAETRPVS